MRRILAIIVGLGGAGLLSQFPEYVQQYTQRVGGAQEELRLIAEDFRADAEKSGLSEAEAIQRFSKADDEFLVDRGESMEDTLTRFQFLSEHYSALKSEQPFGPLMAFVKKRDMGIAREAFDDYQPGIPLTQQGATHAGVGFLAGWLPIEGFWAVLAMFGFGRYPKTDRKLTRQERKEEEESRILDR